MEIAGGDIVRAGVAKDRREGLFRSRVRERARDDDRELALVLDAGACRGQRDVRARARERARGLQEEQRLGRDLVAELLRVRPIIAADAHDLRRSDRREEGARRHGDDVLCRVAALPRGARPEERARVVDELREVRSAGVSESDEAHERLYITAQLAPHGSVMLLTKLRLIR